MTGEIRVSIYSTRPGAGRILSSQGLHLFKLPPSFAENIHSQQGQCTFSNYDGIEHPVAAESHFEGQVPCQRDFYQPEADKVKQGRGVCVAGAVQRLNHDHPHGIEEKACADNPQATATQVYNTRIFNKQPDKMPRENNKNKRQNCSNGRNRS